MIPLVVTMETIGPLQARIVAPRDDIPVERVIVLLHGFGAPGDDLVSLAGELPLAPGTRYVFPQAPIDLGGGRAWWNIDWQERARYERSGDWEGYTRLVPPGLAAASQAIEQLLDVIESKWHVPPTHIVLGGFSQGAMMTVDVAARRAHKPRMLVLLSGALVATPHWVPQAASLKGLPIFQSHGTSDATLPLSQAEKLRDQLGAAGARVAWMTFSGGHAIPREVLSALRTFLFNADGTLHDP